MGAFNGIIWDIAGELHLIITKGHFIQQAVCLLELSIINDVDGGLHIQELPVLGLCQDSVILSKFAGR